jgi:hypothetical protein
MDHRCAYKPPAFFSSASWALFDDAPLVHHDDAVSVAQAQAMRNDDHGAAFADGAHVALQDGFAFEITSGA